jgi:hypothetical protein|tara:strand:- start:242 stop:691 length:450 start_codon:yes stop_codon:yes gene_type:complete
MTNLILSIIITNLLNFNSRYSNFEGTWKSESTKYTLVINKNNNNFEIINYKIQNIKRCSQDVEGHKDLVFSPEEFKKAENGKLYSYVSWDDFGGFYCDVVYEIINEDKLKATFSGSRNLVIYYERAYDENNAKWLSLPQNKKQNTLKSI